MESSGQEKKQKKKKKMSRKKLAVIIILGICVLAAAAYGIYRWIVNDQISEEPRRENPGWWKPENFWKKIGIPR